MASKAPKALLQKCVLLSLMIALGTPYLCRMRDLTCFTTVLALSTLVDTASIHLDT